MILLQRRKCFGSICTYLITGGVRPPNPKMAADDASLIAVQSKLLITVKKNGKIEGVIV